VKKFGEKGAWPYLGTDEIFRYPGPYYLRNGKPGKATDFKFGRYIHFRASIRTKSH